MKLKTLTINRRKWRTGQSSDNGSGKGDTLLRNNKGYMCCLGFAALQCGLKYKNIFNVAAPASVCSTDQRRDKLNMFVTKEGRNNVFCRRAMTINDDMGLSREKREQKLIAHFAKKGVKVIFKGKYE